SNSKARPGSWAGNASWSQASAFSGMKVGDLFAEDSRPRPLGRDLTTPTAGNAALSWRHMNSRVKRGRATFPEPGRDPVVLGGAPLTPRSVRPLSVSEIPAPRQQQAAATASPSDDHSQL